MFYSTNVFNNTAAKSFTTKSGKTGIEVSLPVKNGENTEWVKGLSFNTNVLEFFADAQNSKKLITVFGDLSPEAYLGKDGKPSAKLVLLINKVAIA